MAIGNDLGALHLIAAAGALTIPLFASAVDAAAIAPRGHVTVLHAVTLKELKPEDVARSAVALVGATA